MKKIHTTTVSKVALSTLGQSIYFKKRRVALDVSYLIERFLLNKFYAKNR